MTAALPSYRDVEEAAARLAGVANRTPVLTSRTVNDLTAAQVFFKCENFQRIGAFKFRGAYNVLSQLSTERKQRGVIAYSSGNHAQAVALAGRLLDVSVTIVMPRDASAIKIAATRGYGAEVVLCDFAGENREEITKKIATKRGLENIPPFNHPHVIAGQGTAAKELFEEVGTLDYLLVCVGGGGLISGCALAAHGLSPGCNVIGVEPELGDDATRSFHSRTLQTAPRANETIADGARTPSLGSLTFPLILKHCHDMLTVSDNQLMRTMRFLFERMKIVVEPTGALAATALLEKKINVNGAKVGVIISGGNVDLAMFAQVLTSG
ncbi:MAG: threo-3-hydroxy-L-aspartate ammonia-lyase [Burkholderiales bacterium]